MNNLLFLLKMINQVSVKRQDFFKEKGKEKRLVYSLQYAQCDESLVESALSILYITITLFSCRQKAVMMYFRFSTGRTQWRETQFNFQKYISEIFSLPLSVLYKIWKMLLIRYYKRCNFVNIMSWFKETCLYVVMVDK